MKAAVPDDPNLALAARRIAAIELQEAEEAAAIVEAERQRQERKAAKAVAMAELQAAQDEAEAQRLSKDLPVAAREIETHAKTLRAALAVVGDSLPRLVAAEARYAALWRRAEPLLGSTKALRSTTRARPLGGLSGPVLHHIAGFIDTVDPTIQAPK
jgi:hypothetical protein